MFNAHQDCNTLSMWYIRNLCKKTGVSKFVQEEK